MSSVIGDGTEVLTWRCRLRGAEDRDRDLSYAGMADFGQRFGSLGDSTDFSWLRIPIISVVFCGFRIFFNDFRDWGRGSGQNFFRFRDRGVNLLDDVGSRCIFLGVGAIDFGTKELFIDISAGCFHRPLRKNWR